jgi:hypothetical protein
MSCRPTSQARAPSRAAVTSQSALAVPASGSTSPLPPRRSSHAHTAKVQRESTRSSTSSTGPPGTAASRSARAPSRLRARWIALAIAACSGRASLRASRSRKGRPSAAASLPAKSGTSPGWRSDGTQATQAGAGRGPHARTMATKAPTSASSKRPSCCLPRATSVPQPASRHTDSARPGIARRSAPIRPLARIRGMPPAGHCRRGSIGRWVRRRKATASRTRPSSAVAGSGASVGGRTVSGSPSSARTRKAMCSPKGRST